MNTITLNKIHETIRNESFETKMDIYLFIKFIYQDLSENKVGVQSFRAFSINDIYLDEYIHDFCTKNNDFLINGIAKKAICEQICNWKKNNKRIIVELRDDYYNIFNKKTFPKVKLIEFVEEETSCHYCGISEPEFKELMEQNKLYRRNCNKEWKFEIARKNEYMEHSPKNSIVCCSCCKESKGENFTHEEFKKVGWVFRDIWNERLKGIKNNSFRFHY